MTHFKKILLACVLISITGLQTEAQSTNNSLRAEIQKQVNMPSRLLVYPQSVLRYYTQTNFQPTWIKPQKETGQTWQAMLMLDCVLTYGLSHDDYHPEQITYPLLRDILETPAKIGLKEQAAFDILLTDAMITMMNNLHYGKLNPDLSAEKIDKGANLNFLADQYLISALKQNDLTLAIGNVQPQLKLYIDLQRRMQLLKGKFQSDCYEVPEAEVRKIAINMERLRWAAVNGDNYLLVNIPTYSLTYQLADTAYRFKIAVGKPETPTPVLVSMVDYFTTAPDAKVMQDVFLKEILPNTLKDINYLKNNHYAIYDRDGLFILPTPQVINDIANHPEGYYARHSSGLDMTHGNLVFNFPNTYQVYLHDMPKKEFFDQQERAFSAGCIWLGDAEKLGELLLRNDGAAKEIAGFRKSFAKYQRNTFTLKTKVPIHIVYITCDVNDWGLVTYNDIYNLDKGLEMALYNVYQPLSLR